MQAQAGLVGEVPTGAAASELCTCQSADNNFSMDSTKTEDSGDEKQPTKNSGPNWVTAVLGLPGFRARPSGGGSLGPESLGAAHLGDDGRVLDKVVHHAHVVVAGQQAAGRNAHVQPQHVVRLCTAFGGRVRQPAEGATGLIA